MANKKKKPEMSTTAIMINLIKNLNLKYRNKNNE